MKMKKSGTISFLMYLAGMAALIVWVCSANAIIAGWNNKELVKKVDYETVRNSYLKDHIYQVVDYLKYDGGMLDKLSVSGWAFCETESDNSDRNVFFLLKGSDICYEITPYITTRADVPIEVPIDLNRPDMKISSNTGYTGQISLLDVRNGIYDIYLCCQENETNYGMEDLLYQLKKQEENVEIYIWHAKALRERMTATEQKCTVGYLDKINTEEDYFRVYGWEYIPDKNCDNQKVYVEIVGADGTTKQYESKMLTRTDVAKVYNNEYYAQSGYQSNIPIADFADGDYTVRILVENEGEVWQSKEYKMQIQDGIAAKKE